MNTVVVSVVFREGGVCLQSFLRSLALSSNLAARLNDIVYTIISFRF